MGIPFTRLTELQYRFSMKCPSCPTICQQNVKTSIQVTGIYNDGENRQTKLKKSSSHHIQQGNLC
ncbi:hypothetical protein CYD30_04515 [Kosakonia cowanii]|uniref:Uncharacterized protein n=1 Tax=Kosakonia cowanii JCM 10956 = DSM 18146 TaxID=1300165 RepID=A0A807LBP1_9ENTR|nr:hypothetical protein BWI95_08795 [Kosakonia cowanii JCM 10956 = DSM 18146]TNL12800.1 hypothetical protein CYD30_04515 [Kosakonia cowanii]